MSKAVATNEVNAAMGIICATPTAGSAGTVPGVLFALREKLQPAREEMIEFLFTAGAFGMVVANNACISGAAEDAKLKLVQQVEWQLQLQLKWLVEHKTKQLQRWQFH